MWKWSTRIYFLIQGKKKVRFKHKRHDISFSSIRWNKFVTKLETHFFKKGKYMKDYGKHISQKVPHKSHKIVDKCYLQKSIFCF